MDGVRIGQVWRDDERNSRRDVKITGQKPGAALGVVLKHYDIPSREGRQTSIPLDQLAGARWTLLRENA